MFINGFHDGSLDNYKYITTADGFKDLKILTSSSVQLSESELKKYSSEVMLDLASKNELNISIDDLEFNIQVID